MTRFLAWVLLASLLAPAMARPSPGAEAAPFQPTNPEVIALPSVEIWPASPLPPIAASKAATDPAPVPSPSGKPADARVFSDPHVLVTEPWIPPVIEHYVAESLVLPPPGSTTGPPKLWSGSLSMGLNGNEGNSQTFNFRLGFNAKRKTPDHVISMNGDYNRMTSANRETANRALFDSRYERLFGESPWTWFAHDATDYDESQPYLVRFSSDTGMGYRAIKNATTSLMGRLGAGFSHEMAGTDKSYKPEMLFGSDFEHRFTPRQKVTCSFEYTPDIVLWNDYRLRTKASWEVLLDAQLNLSLQVNVLDRYDSSPGSAKPNDLDYSLVLLWAF